MDKANQAVTLLENAYNQNITTGLDQIPGKQIALWVVILVVFIFISRLFNLTISTIFFIGLALVIIYLLYSKSITNHIPPAESEKLKLDLIRPHPKRLNSNYPDLIDFLYSIRSYYYLNPDDFYSIINNLDDFVQLYEEIMKDDMKYCVQNLEVAVGFSRLAENHLQSMIYSLSSSRKITKRFHQQLDKFRSIMNSYITRMANKCNKNFSDKNNQSAYYQLEGPKPSNYFSQKEGSKQFEFY
jgi:hypothetical protein